MILCYLGVLYGITIKILHDNLGMRKLSARWVPRLLMVNNKRILLLTLKQCLDLFKRNPQEFLRRIVIANETWIHYYTPETKWQSKQCLFPGESAPKKAKRVSLTEKVMAMIFWDLKGIIPSTIHIHATFFCPLLRLTPYTFGVTNGLLGPHFLTFTPSLADPSQLRCLFLEPSCQSSGQPQLHSWEWSPLWEGRNTSM